MWRELQAAHIANLLFLTEAFLNCCACEYKGLAVDCHPTLNNQINRNSSRCASTIKYNHKSRLPAAADGATQALSAATTLLQVELEQHYAIYAP